MSGDGRPRGSVIPVVLSVLDAFVLVAVARHREWFDWRPGEQPRRMNR